MSIWSNNQLLTWVLGFPLQASSAYSWGFDVDASLPTHRHMSRILRELPRSQSEFLLRSSVHLLKSVLPTDLVFGDEISLDSQTHHCLGTRKQPKRIHPRRAISQRQATQRRPRLQGRLQSQWQSAQSQRSEQCVGRSRARTAKWQ